MPDALCYVAAAALVRQSSQLWQSHKDETQTWRHYGITALHCAARNACVSGRRFLARRRRFARSRDSNPLAIDIFADRCIVERVA